MQLSIFQLSQAQDWAGLHRYQAANEKLKGEPVPGDRVVFMGNSITDSWINASSDFWAGNH